MAFRIHAALACLLLIFFSSCENENSPPVTYDSYYAEYEYRYDEDLDRSYVKAVFKENDAYGDKIRLVGSAEVNFNGQDLAYNKRSVQYESVIDGYVEQGTFTYKDQTGQEFINTLSINPIGLVKHLDTIKLSENLSIIWKGADLQKDEDIRINFSNRQLTEAYYYQFADVDSNLTIQSSNLSLLSEKDSYRMRMSRNSSNPLQQGTEAGGIINATYQDDFFQVIVAN